MKVLFYCYNSIVEQHIIDCFKAADLEVVKDTRNVENENVSATQIVEDMSKWLKNNKFLFVFSINFFSEVSNVCEIYGVPYVCWTVDSPFIQLFSPALKNKCNRIFFFDRAQYETFGKPLGNTNGFYLPLAGNVARFQKTITDASLQTKKKFYSDVSLVGSLYNEKNPYVKIQNMPEYLRGYVDGIEKAQMQVYGYNLIEDMLTPGIIEEFSKIIPDLRNSQESLELKRYKLAHFFIGSDLAYHERVTLLNALAENLGDRYTVDLYTLSDTSELRNVRNRGRAQSFSEMPIIFNQSKINLNITMRPIMTGLSQRVFDVLACGGFLLTNYQEELPEMFEIGEEVECFSSKEELLEKTKFYLEHDELRSSIAEKGFKRVENCYTFEHRFQQMLGEVLRTM